MSLPRPCYGCVSGDHSQHDPKGTTRPGLIGGEYCDCPGDCKPEPLPEWLGGLLATHPTSPSAQCRGEGRGGAVSERGE